VVLALGAAIAGRHAYRWWTATPPAERPVGGQPAARAAHIAFWGLSGALVSAAYVLSSVPIDRETARYLVTVGYAIVAVVAVVAVGPRARAAVAVGACVLVAASAASVARRDIQSNPAGNPTGDVSGPLLHFARAQGLRYGYAGYLDSAPLSWQMKTEVQLYPVEPCGRTLCPFGLHRISSWYEPRPNTRTMLVVDLALPSFGPTGPVAALGPPERTWRHGQLIVYVFGYDIAARFRRARAAT
jgi:hypothetical protein